MYKLSFTYQIASVQCDIWRHDTYRDHKHVICHGFHCCSLWCDVSIHSELLEAESRPKLINVEYLCIYHWMHVIFIVLGSILYWKLFFLITSGTKPDCENWSSWRNWTTPIPTIATIVYDYFVRSSTNSIFAWFSSRSVWICARYVFFLVRV